MAYKTNLKKIHIILIISFCVLITNKVFATEAGTLDIPVREESVTVIKNENAKVNKYKITTGDVLSVSVYGEPDMSQPEIIVRPDGYLTIDPIGEVYAEGLDIKELTDIVENRFKEFLLEPQISINIKDFSPASIYIFGAVEKPGIYQQLTQPSKYYGDTKNPSVKTDMSLINVIGNSGGISVDADLANIKITSTNNVVRKIDLWKFIKDGDVSQNIKLNSGDVVQVPKAETIIMNDDDFKLLTNMSLFPKTFPVRVLGEVNQAGKYDIDGVSPYLTTAVSQASGYTLDANKTIVTVYRQAGNQKLAKIYVDPFKQDFILRPNDVVEVQKRTFMKVVFGADYLARIISPVYSLSNTYNSWAEVFKPDRRYTRY